MSSATSIPSKQRLILTIFGYFCLLIVLSIISVLVVNLGISFLRLIFQKLNLFSLQPSDEAYYFTAYLSNVPTFLLTAGLCFYLNIRHRQVFEKPAYGMSKLILFGISTAILGFVILESCMYLTFLIYGKIDDPVTARFLYFSLPYKILFSIFGAIISPLCEEIFFRRALFGMFRQFDYVKTGIIVSSIFFALAHFSTFIKTGAFFFVGYFIGGVIFAVAYHKTNSIITPIIAHILINSAGFLIDFYLFT